MTRKRAGGKTGARKLKVNKQTVKDLDPKGKKKVVGGYLVKTRDCPGPGTWTCYVCQTAMTYCGQLLCK